MDFAVPHHFGMANKNINNLTKKEEVRKMRCICGKKCRGADLIGNAPESIIVYKGSRLPLRFKEGLGFIGIVALGFLSGFSKTLYIVYQCPACDCFVVYINYENDDGQHNAKVIENSDC